MTFSPSFGLIGSRYRGNWRHDHYDSWGRRAHSSLNECELHKYEIIIYWSNEDAAFVAEVPELPGCAAHGDTQRAALEKVNQAVELWIETAREFGDPVSEPKGERLMLA